MLYDDCPHSVNLYSSAPANTAAGTATMNYTLIQSACPCLINTASASTQALYAQSQIVVTMTVGILSEQLTSTPQNGWKVVAADTGLTLVVKGIRSGRVSALGTIPPLTYLDCSEML